MRKPTRLQIFFARWWLSGIWFVNVIVWPVIFMGGAIWGIPPLSVIAPDWGTAGGCAIAIVFALTFGFFFGVLCFMDVYSRSSPIYDICVRINGGPFKVGDTVQILTGPHRGRVTQIYSPWRESAFRVRLGPEEEKECKDIFSSMGLLRNENTEPTPVPSEGKTLDSLPVPDYFSLRKKLVVRILSIICYYLLVLLFLVLAGVYCVKHTAQTLELPPNQSEASTSMKPEFESSQNTAMPPLTETERRIIRDKGTERAFTGQYWNTFDPGTYVCRQCGAALYRSDSKFASECGWPSFDAEIPGAVKRQPDADGMRTEILCAACGAHLGHVFLGEGFTPRNTRHCVNSASLVLRPPTGTEKTPEATPKDGAVPTSSTQTAIFAGGCFWGVEYYFRQIKGVKSAVSGFTGGTTKNPTYEQVCTGRTGHAEAVRVEFFPAEVSYEKLARLFFEIHDPTQFNRQGPDVGTQYRSGVFYADAEQKAVAERLIADLRARGYDVVTEVTPASEFYPAEAYHQDYQGKHPGHPICQRPVARFDTPVQETKP